MHEFSICGRIVDAARLELSRIDPAPLRLLAVRVVVGRLHQIIPDYLTFAYEILTRDTALDGSIIEIDLRAVIGRCRECAWQGDIEPPIFACLDCGSLDIETVGGDELYLEHLEVESADDSAGDGAGPAARED